MMRSFMASCLVATVSCSAGALAGGFDHTHDMSSASSGEASSYQANKKHNGQKNSWYVGGGAAASWLGDVKAKRNGASVDVNAEGKVTPGGSLFIGRRVTKNVRVEGEFLYRHYDYNTKTSEVDGNALGGLANVYYDFMAGQKFRPYVGAGLGYLVSKFEAKSGTGARVSKGNIQDIAYQVGAGASFALTSDIEAFGGYRYLGTTGGSRLAHEALAGLRYNF